MCVLKTIPIFFFSLNKIKIESVKEIAVVLLRKMQTKIVHLSVRNVLKIITPFSCDTNCLTLNSFCHVLPTVFVFHLGAFRSCRTNSTHQTEHLQMVTISFGRHWISPMTTRVQREVDHNSSTILHL